MLNDFTVKNRATGVLPHTQKLCQYPDEENTTKYFEDIERMTGKASDIAICNGLTLHGALPNKSSNEIRSSVLLQYITKFIKPYVRSNKRCLKNVIDNASPFLRQLLV